MREEMGRVRNNDAERAAYGFYAATGWDDHLPTQ
jgi:hypothetical protein